VLDREIAQAAMDTSAVKRLPTISGINLTVAAGIVAAIGEVSRFASPEKLVSYVGLNPRVRQSGLGLAQHGRISNQGRAHARAMRLPRFSGQFVSLQSTSWSWRPACRLRRLSVSGIPGPNATAPDYTNPRCS
jgi:transposase